MISFKFKDIDRFFTGKVKFIIPVKDIAEDIWQDIIINLKQSRSFDGSPLAPLKNNAYLRLKRRIGRPEIFNGLRNGRSKLMNSIKLRKINNNRYQIYIGNNNNDIMYYLQEGKHPLAGIRRAFGVTQKRFSDIADKHNNKTKIVV